ncbi:ras-related protein Rab-24 [Megalopta genalis]|uniref:ras-related protein Rab-24 n=1 Tax=Megalopta genalis TaxID=115081 RepID=UPI0014434034|nr:ras-related protein Rab-24-like [Megalopta genalis]
MENVDLKIVLLGDKNVGKTCLVTRYIHETFNDEISFKGTIGAAYSSKKVECNGLSIVLGIWDTAGCERYEAMTRMFYREAKAAIVCFDVTTAVTFQRAKFWIRELRAVEESCKIYICGTKNDLLKPDEVQFLEMRAINNYATSVRAKLYITSSKTGENIAELFNVIVQDFVATNPVKETKEVVTLNSPSNHVRNRFRCCSRQT